MSLCHNHASSLGGSKRLGLANSVKAQQAVLRNETWQTTGSFNSCTCHTILHAARWISHLQLNEDSARFVRYNSPELYQRCVSDRVKNIHGQYPFFRQTYLNPSATEKSPYGATRRQLDGRFYSWHSKDRSILGSAFVRNRGAF